MSMIMQALKPHRIRRFGSVLRSEGPRVAVARARTHLKILAQGHGQGAIETHHVQPAGSRFAMGAVWSELAAMDGFHVTGAPAILQGRRSVALIGDLNLPQCRKYRVEQLDELWAGMGIDYAFAHYEDIPRCREILQHASHLVLYRLRSCDLVSMYLYEARRLGIPVLYDIDDPLFSVSAYATYANMAHLSAELRQHFLDEAPLYLDVMNGADALSFSTPGLAAHARRYSSRPAFVRRNFADRETLLAGAQARAATPPGRKGFTIALSSGSKGHDADVDTAREAIAAFLAGGHDRRLLITGELDPTRFPETVQGQIVQRPFTGYAAYLRSLAEADCVLLPLANDPFNRCKSAVRAIDAAAVSVPVIASAVGDFAEFVEEAGTGLLAESMGDWLSSLETLAGESGSARAMGEAARRRLEARWTARAGQPVADPELRRWVEE